MAAIGYLSSMNFNMPSIEMMGAHRMASGHAEVELRLSIPREFMDEWRSIFEGGLGVRASMVQLSRYEPAKVEAPEIVSPSDWGSDLPSTSNPDRGSW